MKKLLAIFLYLGISFATFAQQQVNVSVNVLPPYSNNISELLNNPTRVSINLTNLTLEPVDLKLHFILEGDNGVIIRSRDTYQPGNPITLQPGQTQFLGFRDIEGLALENDVEFLGTTQNQILRTRKIPDGNYSLCVEAYEFRSPGKTAPLSAGFPLGCALNLQLGDYDPPIIISIGDGVCADKVTPSTPQFLTISWLGAIGTPLGLPVNYEVEVVEVYPANREVNDAIFTATRPIFLSEVTPATVFNINNIHQQMKLGAKYVLRVRAFSPDSAFNFRNNGYSQVCQFTYGDEPNVSNSNFGIDLLAPAFADTLPFQVPAVLGVWYPYSNDVEEVDFTLTFKENSQLIDERVMEFEYPNGPKKFVESANGNITLPEAATTYFTLKGNNTGTTPLFIRGRTYDAEIAAELRLRNNPIPQNINKIGTFNYGMGKPQIVFPENDASIDTGKITFRIKPAKRPNNPFSGLSHIDKVAKAYGYDSVLVINETLVIEFATTAGFDSVYRYFRFPFKKFMPLANDVNLQASFDSIYNEIAQEVHFPLRGKYWWRAKWLTNPDDTAKTAEGYIASDVFILNATDTLDRGDTECLSADCNFPPLAAYEMAMYDTLKVNDMISIGHHKIKVTKINSRQPGSTFSGEGLVMINPVPGLGTGFIPVKVSFTGVRINAQKRVYEGTAKAINDNGDVPASVLGRVSNMAAFSALPAATMNTIFGNLIPFVSNEVATNTGVPVPIGLKDTKIAGVNYTLAILGIDFSVENAFMNVALQLNNASLGGRVNFLATGICLRENGFSVAKVDLQLMGNQTFNIGSSLKLVLEGGETKKTHISWTCKGFKNLRLEGYFEVDSNVMKYDRTLATDTVLVKGNFAIDVQKFDDFLIEVNIPKPFVIKGLPKWSFVASNLTIDLSEQKNTPNITFPTGYTGVMDAKWQGLYIKDLTVNAPKGFQTDTIGKRLSFQSKDLLIDRTGISTNLLVNNLITVDKGNAGGWDFGIDKIDVVIRSSSFVKGEIKGKIRIPVDTATNLSYVMLLDYKEKGENSGEQDTLSYSATVNLQDSIKFDFWKARSFLLPGSRLEFYLDSKDSANVQATMNGRISIMGKFPLVGDVSMMGMNFQGMAVRSDDKHPDGYFTLGTWSFASPQKKVKGFNASINSISPITKKEEGKSIVGVQIDFGLALGMGGNSFGAGSKFQLMAEVYKNSKQKTRFRYHDFKIDSVGIAGDVGVVKVNGYILFFENDPIYADGLKGSLTATFKPGISVSALAYFGDKKFGNDQNATRYWAVFGSVVLPNGIPVLGVEFNGFGGGFYKNMSIDVGPNSNAVTRNVATDPETLVPKLIPAKGSIGFQAMVFMQSVGGGQAWKAAARLGAEFSAAEGLVSMSFGGNLWVMSPPNEDGDIIAHTWAGLALAFDFREGQEKLTGNFQVFMQKKVGPVEIYGIGVAPNQYRIGQVIFHTQPSANKHYIWIGTPSDRVGIALKSPNVQVNAYIMMGTEVHGIPPLDPRISNLMAARGLTVSNQRSSEIMGGAGFAFGGQFEINTGKKKFLILTGSFELLLGFDVSLLRYEQASCDGLTYETNIGLDNWYARGQIYAFAKGDIGIDIDIWGIQETFQIFSGQAAAVVEGGLPNPIWVVGQLAGQYSLLGGSIEGNFAYEFSAGKICRPTYVAESPATGIKVVSDIKPTDGTTGFSVFGDADLLMNIKPDVTITFDVIDANGQKRQRKFMPKVSYTVKQANNNANVAINLIKVNSAGKEIYRLRSAQPYNPNTRYRLEVKEWIMEWKNNAWIQARDKNNQVITSTRIIFFTTGNIPSTIPEQQVTNSVPFIREDFWNRRSTTTGSFMAKNFSMSFTHNFKNQYFYDSTLSANLMESILGKKVPCTYLVKFTSTKDNSSIERPLQVSQGFAINSNTSIPALQPNTVYKVEVIRRRPAGGNQVYVISGFVNTRFNTAFASNLGSTVNVQNTTFGSNYQGSASQISGTDFSIITTYFRTSRYEDASDKITNLTYFSYVTNGSLAQFLFNGNEQFSKMEVERNYKFIEKIDNSKPYYKRVDSAYRALNIAEFNVNAFRSQLTWNYQGFTARVSFTMPSKPIMRRDTITKYNGNGWYMHNFQPIQGPSSNEAFASRGSDPEGTKLIVLRSDFENVYKSDLQAIKNYLSAFMLEYNRKRVSTISITANTISVSKVVTLSIPQNSLQQIQRVLDAPAVSRSGAGTNYSIELFRYQIINGNIQQVRNKTFNYQLR